MIDEFNFYNSTWQTTSCNQDSAKPATNSPIFRRIFELVSEVESAKLHICGLGHYELFLNGSEITVG